MFFGNKELPHICPVCGKTYYCDYRNYTPDCGCVKQKEMIEKAKELLKKLQK